MQSLSNDIITNELLMTLSYQDLIYLCQINKKFNLLCHDELWIFLLKRDFAFIYHDVDAKQQYLRLNNTLNYFSQYFKLITYDVLMILNYYLPSQYWHYIIDDTLRNREKGYSISYLNRGMLGAIIDNSMYDYINGQILTKFKFNLNILYDELNLDYIASQIYTCQDYIDIVTKPTLVFLYGKITIINHNLDLYDLLPTHMTIACTDDEEQIYHYYVNLLK